MADPHREGQTPERYEETENPRNPPYSVTNRAVRRAALRSYLVPLVAAFIVAGLGLIYWANRGPVYDGVEDGRVGTSGETGMDAVGERGGRDMDSPGGFDPTPQPDDTRDELERRGVGSPTGLPGLTTIGSRIEVSGARVVDAQSATQFWIEKDGARVAVTASAGGAEVRNGQLVDVSGVVESDGRGGMRIRATQITAGE